MPEHKTFFHVGYARAASTFLQKTIFPALSGIQYIPRNNFRVRESEKKRFRADKVLMSREAGEYIFDRVDRVQEVFGSRVIISLRRHDSLAASTYRLYAKNGHTFRFDQFLDLQNNDGVRKIEDFTYLRLFEHVEKVSGYKPLVLIFEDYISDPDFYIETLCTALGCDIDRAKLNQRPVHKSYSDKQLRLRRQFSDRFLSPEEDKKRLDGTSVDDYNWLKSIKERVLIRVSGAFMRLARWAPDSWLNDEPLLIDSHSQAIRNYFELDWKGCYDYVARQSVELGVERNKPAPY